MPTICRCLPRIPPIAIQPFSACQGEPGSRMIFLCLDPDLSKCWRTANGDDQTSRLAMNIRETFLNNPKNSTLCSSFVTEIQTEMRLRSCPYYLYRNLGPCSMLVEEGIDGLQQDRFPPCHHVRQLCLHSGLAMKFKLVSIEAVLSIQVDLCTRHLETQLRKGKETI